MKHPVIKSFIVGMCVAIGLAGCATGPSFEEYSRTAPPVSDGQARVWVYRPSKMMGAAVQPQVMMNEQSIGKSQPGAFFYADNPPGTYEIKCTTEWSDKCEVQLERNETKYIRLTLLPGVFVGHIKPSVVPEAKALKEISKCRLLTADGRNAELAK